MGKCCTVIILVYILCRVRCCTEAELSASNCCLKRPSLILKALVFRAHQSYIDMYVGLSEICLIATTNKHQPLAAFKKL